MMSWLVDCVGVHHGERLWHISTCTHIYIHTHIYLSQILASPRYFWTNSDPTTEMKDAVVALATAFAIMVLPVPE